MAPAYICCAVSRVPAPAVFSSLNAKGGDSLHELDVPDRVRVCTACGTCSTFTVKPPKLSIEIVLRRIPDCLRRHQRAEMRVAFRECMQRVQVEVRVYRISEVCKPPAPSRHRLPTRSQPVRGQSNSRISVYRWSKIGRVARPRQYACNDRGGRNPKVG